MLRNDDNETEILLGNKQLLGVFFVVAILLGIAFYGGYMVGKTMPGKKPVTAGPVQESSGSQSSGTGASGGETHTLSGDTSTTSNVNPTDATEPDAVAPSHAPLGTPKRRKPESLGNSAPQTEMNPKTTSGFVPQAGQEFLQVAAVGRDEALGVANVLHAKGFRAHAVPKPGNPKLYRVLVGPLRDAGDLSSTRDALRKTGFREVIVQKY